MAYSFEIQEHASCCGVKHLCSFERGHDDNLEYTSIASGLADIGPNILAEITLTDSQMQDMPDAVRDMVAADFVLVLRFRNSNSSNIVNVFHRVPTSEPINQAPGWNGNVSTVTPVVRVMEEPVAVVVHSTFHNVYRGGRLGAGYDTLEQAREARHNAGRVDRCDYYSDGAKRWGARNV